MNYQNYYYPNYSYPPYQPSYQQQMLQSYQQAQILNGKIVDSEDVVKATEVPIGNYGVFPKADLSEIYVKSWNNNGTTNLMTFKPVIPQNQTPQESQLNTAIVNEILNKIQSLENKVDEMLKTAVQASGNIKIIQKEG